MSNDKIKGKEFVSLDQVEADLRAIPGMGEFIDQATAKLEHTRYKVKISSILVVGTALELVQMAWASGVNAYVENQGQTGQRVVTIGPIQDFAAAMELVTLVNGALPLVQFQVLGFPVDDPNQVEVVLDGPHYNLPVNS